MFRLDMLSHIQAKCTKCIKTIHMKYNIAYIRHSSMTHKKLIFMIEGAWFIERSNYYYYYHHHHYYYNHHHYHYYYYYCY